MHVRLSSSQSGIFVGKAVSLPIALDDCQKLQSSQPNRRTYMYLQSAYFLRSTDHGATASARILTRRLNEMPSSMITTSAA